MKKLSSYISTAFSGSSETDDELRRAIRAGKVRSIWKELVEDAILEHTNGVYILEEDGRKIMHVYVDEGIYAAELNNRRELIQLLCHQRYGEAVEEFQIHISYGLMKQRYPFCEESTGLPDKNPSAPLSDQELEAVNTACASIPNQSLRDQFRKAMISDLEWKKGNL